MQVGVTRVTAAGNNVPRRGGKGHSAPTPNFGTSLFNSIYEVEIWHAN